MNTPPLDDQDAQMNREGECQRFREELQRKMYALEEMQKIEKVHMMFTLNIIILMWFRFGDEYLIKPRVKLLLQDQKVGIILSFFFDTILVEIKKFQQSQEEGNVIMADLLKYTTFSFNTEFHQAFARLTFGFPKDEF